MQLSQLAIPEWFSRQIGYAKNTNHNRQEAEPLNWVYWAKLYESKFQAGCLAKRMEEDWWIYGYECPQSVEIYRSTKGRFGVRYRLIE
jgi:hypothetical protein